jgi:hypothetical protein
MPDIIQFTNLQFTILIIAVGAIQFLATNWIKYKLEKSIAHKYNKKLEDYKFSILQREQASKIAELFSKWGKYAGQEKTMLDENALKDYYEKITRMSFELSLWITDEDLVIEIMNRLMNKKDALATKEVLIKIREHILNKKTIKLKAINIVHWPK